MRTLQLVLGLIVVLSGCASSNKAAGTSTPGSATVTGGVLVVQTDSDIAAAVTSYCALQTAAKCSGDESNAQCIASAELEMGAEVACKSQVLDIATCAQAQTIVCDPTNGNHSTYKDPKACDTQLQAFQTCQKAHPSEFFGGLSCGGITGGAQSCDAADSYGHVVKFACDGTKCVCSFDGTAGASATDPKDTTANAGDVYLKLFQATCFSVK